MKKVNVYLTGDLLNFTNELREMFEYGLDFACDNCKAIYNFDWRDPYEPEYGMKCVEEADVVIVLCPNMNDPWLKEEIELAKRLGKIIVMQKRTPRDVEVLYRESIEAVMSIYHG